MNPSREVIDRSERQPHTDFRTTHYIDAPARSHTSISSLADDQQLTCSHVTKPGASPPTSLGCPRTSGEPRSRNDLRTLLAYCSASDFGPTSPRGAPRDKIYDPCSHRAR